MAAIPLRDSLATNHCARAWALLESGFGAMQDEDEDGMTPRQAAIFHLQAAIKILEDEPKLKANHLQRMRRARERAQARLRAAGV